MSWKCLRDPVGSAEYTLRTITSSYDSYKINTKYRWTRKQA